MKTAAYKVVSHKGHWGVQHDGKIEGEYDTKESAFEATLGPASNAIKLGYEVSISVTGAEDDEPALGAR